MNWFDMAATVLVPVETALVAWLGNRALKEDSRIEEAKAVAVKAVAEKRTADTASEAQFVKQLLERVVHLEKREEVREQLREAQGEMRNAKMLELERQNARLEARVDVLKHELTGRIEVAMSAVEQKAAVVLSERMSTEEG